MYGGKISGRIWRSGSGGLSPIQAAQNVGTHRLHQYLRHELDGVLAILAAFRDVYYTEVSSPRAILEVVDPIQK